MSEFSCVFYIAIILLSLLLLLFDVAVIIIRHMEVLIHAGARCTRCLSRFWHILAESRIAKKLKCYFMATHGDVIVESLSFVCLEK